MAIAKKSIFEFKKKKKQSYRFALKPFVNRKSVACQSRNNKGKKTATNGRTGKPDETNGGGCDKKEGRAAQQTGEEGEERHNKRLPSVC